MCVSRARDSLFPCFITSRTLKMCRCEVGSVDAEGTTLRAARIALFQVSCKAANATTKNIDGWHPDPLPKPMAKTTEFPLSRI